MRANIPGLTPELDSHRAAEPIWRASAYRVSTYHELVKHIARLAFANTDDLLFFRGQDKDYQSKAGGTTLYPAIYRGDNVPQRELRYRFELLAQACRLLSDRFVEQGIEGHRDVARKRFVQWSILQHYEVIPTPLLDLTQSIRVACSFAQLASTDPTCYVYVVGLPYVTNRISVNSEHDVVNVRLLSICPPSALRPYFQEGFLAGTSDITDEFDSKTELDFRNRLVAKFAIPRAKKFWGSGFDIVPKAALFPAGDTIEELCIGIREQLSSESLPGDLGTFIREWAELEDWMLEEARRISERNVSMREAISVLAKSRTISDDIARQVDSLRRLRNAAVHEPGQVPIAELTSATPRLREILREARRHASR